MTSELRPAVEVWREAEAEAIEYNGRLIDSDYAAAAVIEADREAVRAEVVGEIVAWLQSKEKWGPCCPAFLGDEIGTKFGKNMA